MKLFVEVEVCVRREGGVWGDLRREMKRGVGRRERQEGSRAGRGRDGGASFSLTVIRHPRLPT